MCFCFLPCRFSVTNTKAEKTSAESCSVKPSEWIRHTGRHTRDISSESVQHLFQAYCRFGFVCIMHTSGFIWLNQYTLLVQWQYNFKFKYIHCFKLSLQTGLANREVSYMFQCGAGPQALTVRKTFVFANFSFENTNKSFGVTIYSKLLFTSPILHTDINKCA